MTRSVKRAKRFALREGLPAGKGGELTGLLLLAVGALLLLSLLSYRPSDPSFMRSGAEEALTSNWIGPVGAGVGATGFGLFGFAVLALPLILLWNGYLLLRGRGGTPSLPGVVGLVIAFTAGPTIISLVLGDISYRGEPFASGGVLGASLAVSAANWFGKVGAGLIALFGLLFGVTLSTQKSLPESLGGVADRMKLLPARFRRSPRRRKPKERAIASDRAVAPSEGNGGSLEELERRRSVDRGAPPTNEGPGGDVAAPKPAVALAARNVRAPSMSNETSSGPPDADPELPPLDLLRSDEVACEVDSEELRRLGELICARCAEFGVEGTIEDISPGPVITVFEFQPAPGVKVAQIVNLQDDLALSLKAEAIRIDRMPGRSTLGIEVPNARRTVIPLGRLLGDREFHDDSSPLILALGRTLRGEPYYADLTKMPHLLVAGATGAGKSVGLQGMLTSILYKARSDEVQFILIDPKRIELGVYADIPHLKTAVVVEPKQAANALRWAVAEMERRYRLLAEVHVRSIDYYNEAIRDPEVARRLRLRDETAEEPVESRDFEPLPYYVIVIDELADLMMVASSDVETSIARLAQMARAVGIHLIVATQRPSVDVLTGTIKANFPCRISYAAATRHDSRTILDQVGAEKLLGKGDMLFMPPGSARTIRLHGAYVTEQETAALVRWLKRQGQPNLDPAVLEAPPEERSTASDEPGGGDVLYDEAARLVVSERMGSASFLQRRMRVGFSRASRLVDLLEQDGILGPPQGSKPRDVLVPPDYFEEIEQSQMALE